MFGSNLLIKSNLQKLFMINNKQNLFKNQVIRTISVKYNGNYTESIIHGKKIKRGCIVMSKFRKLRYRGKFIFFINGYKTL